VTFQAISKIPGLSTCLFSVLAPRTHIPPHRGPYAGVLRCHLPLIIPQPSDQCWIRIDQERYHWEYGKALIFDDSYEHEVENATDEYRIVLFIDFLRPLPEQLDRMNQYVLRESRLSKDLRRIKPELEAWEQRVILANAEVPGE
jgi:beta-hydroxylase